MFYDIVDVDGDEVTIVVEMTSSRTDPDNAVVDVTPFSALDVVEIEKSRRRDDGTIPRT